MLWYLDRINTTLPNLLEETIKQTKVKYKYSSTIFGNDNVAAVHKGVPDLKGISMHYRKCNSKNKSKNEPNRKQVAQGFKVDKKRGAQNSGKLQMQP